MPIRRNSAPDIEDYMDDEDETPVRSKRRYDEEDDDEDETPVRNVRTKRAPVDDDEDEDEAPKAKTRRRPVEDDDDEEEEDADTLPKRSSSVQRGWAAARQRAAEGDSYANDFKFSDDEEQIVRFLDDEPLVFGQHWLQNKDGKKSYVCNEHEPKGCPLCDELGDKPASRAAFTVLNASVEGMPTQVLTAGVKLTRILEKLGNHPRTGPLSENYYALSKSGKGLDTTYSVVWIKERDLVEDWEIDPSDVEKALKSTKPLPDDKLVRVSSHRELLDVVKEVS